MICPIGKCEHGIIQLVRLVAKLHMRIEQVVQLFAAFIHVGRLINTLKHKICIEEQLFGLKLLTDCPADIGDAQSQRITGKIPVISYRCRDSQNYAEKCQT